jgi:hypothetical protein
VLLKVRRETGSVAPKPLPKRPFSKIKAILRGLGARTQETSVEAIAQALDAVSRGNALGWFAHCGYRLADRSA